MDRELSRGKVIWESQRLQQADADSPTPEWLDEFLQDRANAGLEFVFSLLSVLYDRKPLLVAFRSLHTNDRHLRGTALEYLQGILPTETCRRLWDLLGENPSAAAPRELSAVLNDLADASPTVFLRLQVQRENGETPSPLLPVQW